MAAARGGVRQGAGRKPKAEKFARPIARAEKQIVDRLPELIDRMMILANGVTVQEANPVTGDDEIYTRTPDRQALEYLINRIMGKPTERRETEHSGTLDFGNMTDDQLRAIIEK